MRILLWDIDGTLISTGGAGMRALARAVSLSEAATEALRRMRLDGMTDRKIARILCAAIRHRHGPEKPIEAHQADVTEDEIDDVLRQYLEILGATLPLSTEVLVLPGVVDVMDALGPDQALHALGTGNVEQGARVKLTAAGLWHRFAFGGFGSDAEERSAIIRAAWAKAEKHLGHACQAGDFVVIGDTPKDIAAAHDCGIACVAVASGRHSVHELAENGADLAVETLAKPDLAARILKLERSS